jgi:hypothetical protein
MINKLLNLIKFKTVVLWQNVIAEVLLANMFVYHKRWRQINSCKIPVIFHLTSCSFMIFNDPWIKFRYNTYINILQIWHSYKSMHSPLPEIYDTRKRITWLMNDVNSNQYFFLILTSEFLYHKRTYFRYFFVVHTRKFLIRTWTQPTIS